MRRLFRKKERKNLFPHIPTQRERQAARLKMLDGIRNRWWKEGKRTCALCGKEIRNRADYTLDHETPGKMGGCKNDDIGNLRPAHWSCNEDKGGTRLPREALVG